VTLVDLSISRRVRVATVSALWGCLTAGDLGCGGAGRTHADGGAGDHAPAVDARGLDAEGEAGTQFPVFAVSAELSARIQTVAVVTWATDLPVVRSARIEFGPTPTYGMVAPVDLLAPSHRTLLLGMKPNRVYHYRIVVSDGTREHASPDHTITTGSLPNGLPRITVVRKSAASSLFGGFLLTGQYLPVPTGGMPAYVVDADGDLVWAYSFPRDVTGARMSQDGRHVWLNSANTPSTQGAMLRRVAMDGSTEEDFSTEAAGLNHQLAVLPDETLAFGAYGAGGCDDLKELSPATRAVRTVANTGLAQGGAAFCHIVNLQYSRDDDALVFSDSVNQVVAKVRRRDGATLWVLGGPSSTIVGAPWAGSQHSLHLLGRDHFLLFNNNSRAVATGAPGTGEGSIVMELRLDLVARTAEQMWSYRAEPGIPNDIMGDTQRLPNGNTVIAYSNKGVLHEVSADGTLLEEWTWPLGASFGYIEKRATLYGPPPR